MRYVGKVIVFGDDPQKMLSAITQHQSEASLSGGPLYTYVPMASGEMLPSLRVKKSATLEDLSGGIIGGDVVGLILTEGWKKSDRYTESHREDIRRLAEEIGSMEGGEYFVRGEL